MMMKLLLLLPVALAQMQTPPMSCDETIFGGEPGHAKMVAALKDAVAAGGGGFGNDMWATVVDMYGNVCDVCYSGESFKSQSVPNFERSKLIILVETNKFFGFFTFYFFFCFSGFRIF